MEKTANPLYQTVISAARELARDTLRTRNIHKLIRDKAELNRQVDEVAKDADTAFQEAKKQLAIVNYKISKVDEADPEAKEKLEALGNQLENATKALGRAEDAQKQALTFKNEVGLELTKLDERIAKWETGESKVQLENLNELAREYVELAFQEKAKALAR